MEQLVKTITIEDPSRLLEPAWEKVCAELWDMIMELGEPESVSIEMFATMKEKEAE